MTTQTTSQTQASIYTVCVGSGRDRYLQIPEDGHTTLTRARAIADMLRTEGYRGVYIVDHVTGQAVR